MKKIKHVAILGGGPSGLFMFKRLVDAGSTDFSIDIFEKKRILGSGMPYSSAGANDEHVTNVSGNEIPAIATSIAEWLKTMAKENLERFNITPANLNDYKVLPRLFFGQYLMAQFEQLLQAAKASGIVVNVHFGCEVTDVKDQREQDMVTVTVNDNQFYPFETVIICTGHSWPQKYEGKVPGFYDSPYPPAKLALQLNHPVAIKGASLTAVDAIRTLALFNGSMLKQENGKLTYELAPASKGFKMVLHSRNGMLPAVRFHLDDPHLSNDSLLTPEEIAEHIAANDGFLSLDFVFEKDFKEIFRDKDPEFYQRIKYMNVEEFVAAMMELREKLDPFLLLKAEYAEAEKSIKRRESVYWKEMLGVLSFAMNYPAKHFSAEDMHRLQKTLQPLISIVIAYIPQSSCEVLMALHDAGVLDIVHVGEDSHVEAAETGATYHYTGIDGQKQVSYFRTFIDAVGQPHLSYTDFPFKSMIADGTISPAKLKFRSAAKAEEMIKNGNDAVEKDRTGNYFLQVPGITINDHFQVVDKYGAYNDRIYIMAVPYIGGYNPDYSGLDFCEEASGVIIKKIMANEK